MSDRYWNELRGLHVETDPGEQFIESSKLGVYDEFPSQEAVIERMQELLESLPYDGYPATKLPPPATIDAALSTVIEARVSARFMKPQQLDLSQLATLLHASNGITAPTRAPVCPPVPHRSVGRRPLPARDLLLHQARHWSGPRVYHTTRRAAKHGSCAKAI